MFYDPGRFLMEIKHCPASLNFVPKRIKCIIVYVLRNELSNKNDPLQSTRNLIGRTIFLTSEKYRMTNPKPQTEVFTSDKKSIVFPAFH